jgi:hypothetical protein
MLRFLLAGALGLLLLASSPLSAQTSPDVIGGRMRGAWDLPTDLHPGRARGVMYYLGQVVVGLDARLTPITDPTVKHGGRIDGILRRKTDRGFAPDPIAEVHGTYIVGPDGQGQFEAVIVPLATTDVRPEPIGKMAGVFSDPMLRDRDPVGTFLGRWAMRR